MDLIEKLKVRRDQIADVRKLAHGDRTDATEFMMWWKGTLNLLRRIFGKDSVEEAEFAGICFTPRVAGMFYVSGRPISRPPDRVEPFLWGCKRADAVLTSIIEEVEEFGVEATDPVQSASVRVFRILDRFGRVAGELRRRQRDRDPLAIDDEYDVQDLLRALLHVDFEDVRPEEPTPSHAGAGSRLDFLLKAEQIGIETKMVRSTHTDAGLRGELAEDITLYAAHPHCRELYFLVYDPDARLKQPAAIEKDLSQPRNDCRVTVLVRPSRS